MKERKAHNFYRSYYELAEDLNDEQRGQYYHAIFKMQFEGEIEEPSDPMARLAFKGQLFTLRSQLEGFQHVQKRPTPKGGLGAPSQGGSKAPSQQVQVQEQGKEKVKEEPKGIEYRKNEFSQKILPHIDKEFTREDANDFFRYWTEMNEGGKKMRFEMQKVFEVKKRIVTWKRNKKTNGNKNTSDNKVSAAEYLAARMQPIDGQNKIG